MQQHHTAREEDLANKVTQVVALLLILPDKPARRHRRYVSISWHIASDIIIGCLQVWQLGALK